MEELNGEQKYYIFELPFYVRYSYYDGVNVDLTGGELMCTIKL